MHGIRRDGLRRRPSWLRKAAALIGGGALVASGLTAATAVLIAPEPASAVSSADVGAESWGPVTYNAYAAAGETVSVDFSAAIVGAGATPHTIRVTDPAGVVAYECTVGTTAGSTCASGPLTSATAGVWTIEDVVEATGGNNMTMNWDITVASGAGEQTGRVWSSSVALRQLNGAENLQDFRFWMVSDAGYQYDVSLNDYNGILSTIVANSLGVTDAECVPTYQSQEASPTTGLPVAPLRQDCGPQYRLFFEAPSAALPATAQSATGVVSVLPAPITTGDLTVEDLAFTPATTNSANGTFTYSIDPRFSGGYQLQIDTNGNGSYDDAVDRIISLGADGSGEYSYDFDGIDGAGNPIADCTGMNARIFFDKVGEVHVLQSDVEGRVGGIEVTRTNGPGAPDSTVYWDDTALAQDRSNTTPVLDGTAGVDSSAGVHGWGFSTTSWGNNRVIDDWTYTPLNFGTGELAIPGRCIDIEKTSDADEDTRVGDTVTFTVTATNTGTTDFTADAPATVSDDMTGVLDDATYNNDATSDLPGTLAYAAPKLSWSGALPAGDTVTIEYTVTVIAGGDGIARNIAYAGPPTETTPVCDPPTEEGTDPATGIPCATTTFEIPRLTIEKTSDVTELPADGGVVTYEVTVTNVGPGVYTADAPAVATDDLSDVLDDAEFGTIVAPTTGATFDAAAETLTWSGPLGVGESVVISYTVTYDSTTGDNVLLNVVCVPESQTAPGAESCDSVRVPGGALDDWKTVDPASGSTVRAGQVVTYTLHFENTGEAAATVNREDVLTQVLDDATVTSQPVASDPALAVTASAADRYLIAGTLQPGQLVTVTYQVTVNADGARGDDQLGNFLVDQGGTPPEECVPTNDQRPDCTVNPVSNVVVTKSANPTSGTQVAQGQRVTYTLTFRNVSNNPAAADVPVDYTDHLVDVLDDATLTQGPQASTAALTATAAGQTIRIVGAIGSGDTVTVTYAVTVKDWAAQGNHSLGNVVAVTGTTPICVPGNGLCTTHPLTEPDPLAITGGEVAAWVVLTGIALLMGGGVLLLVRRRRMTDATTSLTD